MSYFDYDERDYDDYESDTFYALTDGMYGDYEDFVADGGTIDSLMEYLGLD